MNSLLPQFWIVALISLAVFGEPCLAGELAEPVGEKDGLKLFLRLADAKDVDNPEIICEIDNTTDKNVPFDLRGSRDKPPVTLRFLDSDGREIVKTEEWERKWVNGFQRHFIFGMIPKGEDLYRLTIDLQEAYGDDWKRGERLEFVWNEDGNKTGPGPFGGDFGVGDGLKGFIDISEARAREKQAVDAEAVKKGHREGDEDNDGLLDYRQRKSSPPVVEPITHVRKSDYRGTVSVVLIFFFFALIAQVYLKNFRCV